MRKKDISKYFKIFVLMMALLFVTVQAESHGEDFIITSDQNGDDAAGRQFIGDGDTLEIEERGEIVTDDGSDAVYIDQDDNVLINDGLIKAMGERAAGVDIEGDKNTITNNGTITAESRGIHSSGDDNTFINNGLITAEDEGIYSDGVDNTITNYGLITAESRGIYSDGEDNTITNYGLITAEDEGIYSEGARAAITNYGLIEAMYYGIYSSNNGNTISNYGSIRVTGEGSIGILVESDVGETNTINNGGSIYVPGSVAEGGDDEPFAIKGDEGIEILNLFSGSDIIGDIDLGEGNDILNYYIGASVKGRIDLAEGEDTANVRGNGRSAIAHTLTFHGAEDINFHNIIGVRKGNTVTTIDPSIQSVKAPVLNSFTTGLHSVIIERLNTRSNKSRFWADTFHSYRERKSEDLLFKYDHQYNGGMFGYDISDEKIRFGFMAGFSDGNTEGKYNSFETDSDSFFAGIYGQYKLGKIRIATAFIGGYEDHEDERMVIEVATLEDDGYQTAKADHESWFFSPSITLSREFNLSQRWILEPSATAVYSIGWYESYNEKGTVNSNLGIDDRTIEAFNGKVQLKSIYRASDKVQLSVYGGAMATYTDDEDIDGNFGGTRYRYSAKNDDSVYGAQFGANVDFALKDNFDLNFKIEHSEKGGDEKRDFVTGGFLYKF